MACVCVVGNSFKHDVGKVKKKCIFIQILWISGGGSADVDKRDGGSAGVHNYLVL